MLDNFNYKFRHVCVVNHGPYRPKCSDTSSHYRGIHKLYIKTLHANYTM